MPIHSHLLRRHLKSCGPTRIYFHIVAEGRVLGNISQRVRDGAKQFAGEMLHTSSTIDWYRIEVRSTSVNSRQIPPLTVAGGISLERFK